MTNFSVIVVVIAPSLAATLCGARRLPVTWPYALPPFVLPLAEAGERLDYLFKKISKFYAVETLSFYARTAPT